MKSKLFAVACVAALFNISSTAFAGIKAPSEDFAPSNPACTMAVNDNKSTMFINVNYIRLMQVPKNQRMLVISMASNLHNSDTGSFTITYQTYPIALKAMEELNDKINDCQYDAATKRANKKKQ